MSVGRALVVLTEACIPEHRISINLHLKDFNSRILCVPWPNSGPARHELYTGLLPTTSGVYSNGINLGEKYKNIANYLGELGYSVGLTGKPTLMFRISVRSLVLKVEGITVLLLGK